MTAQNPPLYLQAGLHPAEDFRRLVTKLFAARGGVLGPTELLVSERSGTANMSVDVAGGSVIAGSADGMPTKRCRRRSTSS